MKTFSILAAILLLAGCSSKEQWRAIDAKIECRHRAIAWLEQATMEGINCEVVYYRTDEGIAHAIVFVHDEKGGVFVDPSYSFPRRVTLTEKEEESIFYRGQKYQ